MNATVETHKMPRHVQEFPRPDIWPEPKDVSILTPAQRANEIMLEFILSETPYLYGKVDNREGKEYLGEDPGRQNEGGTMRIDKIAEKHAVKTLRKLSRKYDLSFLILSENGIHKVGRKKPQFVFIMDEYDNSTEFQYDLDTPGHLCGGFWDIEGNPITAADGNLFRRHIIVNRDGKNYFNNPNLGKTFHELPTAPKIKDISEERFVVASYDGAYKYTRRFNDNLDRLNRDRNQKGSFHGKTGAHSYGEMAMAGLDGAGLSAYPIFNEPVSELLATILLPIDAGYKPYSVSLEYGSLEEIKLKDLILFYLQNPDRYSMDRIPFLIVTPTLELASQIRDYAFKKSFTDWKRRELEEEFGV